MPSGPRPGARPDIISSDDPAVTSNKLQYSDGRNSLRRRRPAARVEQGDLLKFYAHLCSILQILRHMARRARARGPPFWASGTSGRAIRSALGAAMVDSLFDRTGRLRLRLAVLKRQVSITIL